MPVEGYHVKSFVSLTADAETRDFKQWQQLPKLFDSAFFSANFPFGFLSLSFLSFCTTQCDVFGM